MKSYQFGHCLQNIHVLICLVLFFLAEAVPVRSNKTPTSQQHSSSYHHSHPHPAPHRTTTTSSSSSRHHLERGKILPTSDGLDPADLYAAYQEIRKDYQSKVFHAQGSSSSSSKNNKKNCWKILHQQGDVQVALWNHPDDPTCPYIRMTGRFPVCPQECWDFLKVDRWNDTMPKMDPFYEGVTVHGEFWYNNSNTTIKSGNGTTGNNTTAAAAAATPVHIILCRKRTKRILAFGKRDFVFLSVQGEPLQENGGGGDDNDNNDKTLVSASVSVVTPFLPRMPGYTRAFQDSVAFYKPVENGTATDLTILCRIDLNDSAEDGTGGHIPMWLYVKTIGRTGVQSVLRMRHALMKEKHRQQQQQQRQQMLRGTAERGTSSLK